MISLLMTQITPLLILIALGYIAGRYLCVNLHSLAMIAIYILSPFVIFGAMAKAELQPAYAQLPIVIFIIAFVISATSYAIAKRIWADDTANIVGMASVNGNTGYFGLPLVMALVGEEWVGVFFMMNIAALFGEVTISYYMAARGNFTMGESIRKIFKLPVFYAFLAGLTVNAVDFTLPPIFYTYWTYAAGAWVIIGMMLIGVAVSKAGGLTFGPRMLTHLFIVKFVVWPLAILAALWVDKVYFQSFSREVYVMALIYGLVPLAGNPVAYAAQLGLKSERIALAVILSTVFALIYMPLAMSYLLKTSLFGS